MGIEDPYNPELVRTKEEILNLLREKGYKDPEVKRVVDLWLDMRQNEVFLENTSRATLVLNIERVEIYLADGDVEGAYEVAKEAYMCARQENEEDLVDKLTGMFPELEP